MKSTTVVSLTKIAQMLTSRIGRKPLLLALAATLACIRTATASTDEGFQNGPNADRVGTPGSFSNPTGTPGGFSEPPVHALVRQPSTSSAGTETSQIVSTPNLVNNHSGGSAAQDLLKRRGSVSTHADILERTVTPPSSPAPQETTPKDDDFVYWNGSEFVERSVFVAANNGTPEDALAADDKDINGARKVWNKVKGIVGRYRIGERKAKKGTIVLNKKSVAALTTALTAITAGTAVAGWQLGDQIQNPDAHLQGDLMACAIACAVIAVLALWFLGSQNNGKLATSGTFALVAGGLTVFGMHNAMSFEHGAVLKDGAINNWDKFQVYGVLLIAAAVLVIAMIYLAIGLRENGWAKGRATVLALGMTAAIGVTPATFVLLNDGICDMHEIADGGNVGIAFWKCALIGAGALFAVFCLWYVIMGGVKPEEGRAVNLTKYGGLISGVIGAGFLTAGLGTVGDYATNAANTEGFVPEGETNLDNMGEYFTSDLSASGIFMILAASFLLAALIATGVAKCIQRKAMQG